MTAGHKHHEVKVRKDGLLYDWLTKPRKIYAVVPGSLAWQIIDRSPYPYGPYKEEEWIEGEYERYYLSILSVLHRWTGLTLRFSNDT